MTPERVRQIEELYHAACEGTPQERAALLAQADPELRREVESLLIEPAGGEFLDRPAIRNALQLTQDLTLTRLDSGACLGPYRIECKIGEGGMGEVFRAIDTRLGRAVAIKITREQFNARFQREARAISSLNHPNICILHDVGPNYFVMELVEGGKTIAARLKKGPLPQEEAIRYAGQIAAALEAAHEKGIIHRDLKPGNVMLTKSGAKVLDFGLATLEGDQTLTAERMVIGTPAGMAAGAAGRQTGGCPHRRLRIRSGALRNADGRASRPPAEAHSCAQAGNHRKPVSGRRTARRWQSAAELQRELPAIPKVSRGQNAAAQPSLNRTPKPTRKTRLCKANSRTGPAIRCLMESFSPRLVCTTGAVPVSDSRPGSTSTTGSAYDEPATPETRLTPGGGAGDLRANRWHVGRGRPRSQAWETSMSCGYVPETGSPETCLARNRRRREQKKRSWMRSRGLRSEFRARLGESLSTIGEHSTPLEQATTSSLEALKAYTAAAGTQCTPVAWQPQFPISQRAIAIDPQSRHGAGQFRVPITGTWRQNRSGRRVCPGSLRAPGPRSGDLERPLYPFSSDRQVTGTLQKELETLESWVKPVPRCISCHWVCWVDGAKPRGTGLYERGIQSSEQALGINPDLTPRLGQCYRVEYLPGPVRGSRRRTAAGRGAQTGNPAVSGASPLPFAFLTGDEAGMKREIDRARGNLEAEKLMSHNQALVLARSGQMRNARIRWQHPIELALQAGDREQAIYQAALAVCEAHLGNGTSGEKGARAALELERAAMWSTPRLLRWRSRRPFRIAIALRGPGKAIPRRHSGTVRVSAHAARAFGAVRWGVVGRDRAVTNSASLRSCDAGHAVLRQVRRALSRVCARPGVSAGRARPGGGGGIPKGPGSSRNRSGRSDRRIGALAIGESAGLIGREGQAGALTLTSLTHWKDADLDVPVLKEASAEYAKL